MKLLVFACVLLVCQAAPVAQPESVDQEDLPSELRQRSVFTNIHPISFGASVPVAYSGTHRVVHAGVPTQVVHSSGAVPFAGFGQAQVVHSSGAVPFSAGFGQVVPHGGAAFVPSGSVQFASVPSVGTHYRSAAAIATPAVTQFNLAGSAVSAVNVAAGPVVSTSNVLGAAPAVTTYNTVASVPHVATSNLFAAAPAVTTYNVAAAAPAFAAVPTSITYQSEQTVELPAKEVDVAVQRQTVHVPTEQRIHYGVENIVTGSRTTIHKPRLSAPAIAAPQVFVEKINHAAPEVTIQHSEVTVEKSSPHYVDAPYDAGVIVEQAAPEFNQVYVPTPVEVPHPVPVIQPYSVPVAHPIKVKSSVRPVVNVDVHSVQTENIVTPVEYTAHHHVPAAPVVAHTVPVVAQATPVFTQAVPAVGQAVTYGSASPAITYHHNSAAVVPGVTFREAEDNKLVTDQNIHFQAVNQVPIQQVQFQAVNQVPIQQVQFQAVNQIPIQQFTGQHVQFQGVNQIPIHQVGQVASGGSQFSGVPTAISYSSHTGAAEARQIIHPGQLKQQFAVAPAAVINKDGYDS